MAILHDATLRPTKLEVLQAWVPEQDWYPSGEADFEVLGRFRFDDPDGEVGIETYLLARPDGEVFHVPLTYRGAPLDQPADLIATIEHSVLGQRWVYDAFTDPVYTAVVAEIIRTGGRDAAQYIENPDGTTAEVPATAHAQGNPGAAGVTLDIARRPPRVAEPGPGTLSATWDGADEPVVLANLDSVSP